MLTHLSAKSHESLLAAGTEFLIQHRDSPGVLVISRNKLAADELVYRASHNPMCGVRRLSIEQLSQELARKQLAEERRRTGTHLTLDAITRRACNFLARSKSLRYFGSVAEMPRFSGAVLRTLTELRLEDVEVASLVEAGMSAGDLGSLLDGYVKELEAHKLSDLAYRIQAAIKVAEEGKHYLCGLPLILLCPDLARSAHCELVKSLAANSPDVLGLSLEHEQSQIERVLGVEARPLHRTAQTCLEHAQEELFSLQPGPPRSRDESFGIFSASGEALECVEIVRTIGEMVERGTPFDQIAVLLRSPERYQTVLEEAFDRTKIPAWFSHGCRRPLASGRAFLALLECAREGCSATRFLEYQSLGQVPRRSASAEHSAPLVAPVLWERQIVDASVVGGGQRWQTRLQGLLESLRAKRAALDQESEGDILDKHIAALNGLMEFALPIIRQLENLPVKAGWGDWLDHLRHLALETLENPDTVSELLDEMEPLRGIEDVGIDDVLTLLGDRLRTMRQPPLGERRYGRVFVGEARDAFGMAFDAVFAPGLSEGMFPRPIREDPLFLSDARQRVSSSLRIPHDDEERNLLRAILAAARKVCVCSYPRMDLLTGRAKVPSLYFFEVTRAAYGPIQDLRQMESDARAGAETSAGWPAPQNAIDAVDAAEFDLATLRPALLRTTVPALGAYLTRLEGPIANALRSRWLRWNDKEWKWADGIVDVDPDTLTALDPFSLRKKAYSPSALQEFASCPYRFALRFIHGLRPAERPEMIQRMDPLMRGQFFHRVAYETIRHLMNSELLPVSEANLSTSLEILERVVGETSKEFASQYAPALPAVWEHEVAMIQADLRGWLQSMTRDQNWQPIAGELSFGRPLDETHNPESVQTPIKASGDFMFVGSMDLIERNSAGKYRVTDYKTGRVPYPQPQAVGGGLYLQPLIYSLAAEVMLGKPIVGGRLHFATMRGTYKDFFIALNESNRRSLLKVLEGIDASIRTGFLPAAPKKDACLNCNYLPVCGPYEEDRTRKKLPDRLRVLSEIRGLK